VADATLRELIRPGSRVALGDGYGAPRSVSAELSKAAGEAGGVRLLVGWVPTSDPDLDFTAFADVRAFMGGWGLRRAIDDGQVHYLPIRLGLIPSLLAGPLRPDVLVTSLVRVDGGYAWGSEVSWMRAAVDAGAVVAGVVQSAHPRADAGPPLPADQVVIVGESDALPIAAADPRDSPLHTELARHIAPLVPEGARLQIGPGPLGEAVLAGLQVPVEIDSGMLPAGVAGLHARGLLLGEASATYLAGGAEFYAWSDGRPLLHPIEYTHDAGRLSNGSPFVAVNMAVEIDDQGQINVEGDPKSNLGGIGGHPDYAAAGAKSVGGLSIIAVPSEHRGAPTLVSSLSRPVSTPSHDVEIVVTERGVADLRGLDRAERRAALRRLWQQA
jgi:acyl-CoA hydrolase